MATFWKGKRVLVTGHTGFKGSWLSYWLYKLGANVNGYSARIAGENSFFAVCNLNEYVSTSLGEIKDYHLLQQTLVDCKPEIVFHLAAQPLVSKSVAYPVETYETNIMGTVNLLEAIRHTPSVKAVLVVSSWKCYELKDWFWGYRESDSLGGNDPYSSSKSCAEMIANAYQHSFFLADDLPHHQVAIACVRPGNVIGGGDWGEGRLLPDIMKSFINGEVAFIHNPWNLCPWQHVFEPISGYLLLAEKMFENGLEYNGSWNFGPEDQDIRNVGWIVKYVSGLWGEGANYQLKELKQPESITYPSLDCSKAKKRLHWFPRWRIETALEKTVSWIKALLGNLNMKEFSWRQIQEYIDISEGGR